MSEPTFTVEAPALRTLLATVAPAVAKKSPLSALSGVHLMPDAEIGMLEAFATDLTMGILARCPAVVHKHHAAVAAHDLLSSLSARLAGPVACTVDSFAALNVAAGAVTAKVRTTAVPDDMPNRPNHVPTVTLAAADLKRAIARTEHAIGTDIGRPALTGLSLRIAGGRLEAAATDGFRAALAVVCFRNREDWPAGGVVVPKPAVRALASLLADLPAEATVSVGFSGGEIPNAITVAAGEYDGPWVFSARLIEGTFPDTRRVAADNAKPETSVEVDATELARAIATTTIFGKVWQDEKARYADAILTADRDGLTVKGVDDDKGEAVQTVPAKVDGPDAIARFNGGFLRDIMTAAGGPVAIGLGGERTPGILGATVVTDPANPGDLWLVVPLAATGGH